MIKYKSEIKSERIKLLRKKLEKYKDDILREKAEGINIKELGKKYDINAYTLGDWIFFWENGTKRRKYYKEETTLRKRRFKKRVFNPSQELKNQMAINSEINSNFIKYVKVDSSEDARMIHYICGLSV